ncbi:hypothetical protein HBI24_212230 [Parastagonospora nodorum]|nr:hypothetical protein HBI47_187490 [Parastagonospora nodorum]KAH5571596.1 hypothetical protein HBI24_212230 [Parastagonospora nodorum]KAH5643686.1 hypothetical protein HBI23_191350 [Parastagonospora nodorum]KAH6206294.1 hypothetical protein HBI43_188830 [Parastagonospora nodorum]KAH6244851.1 hypothetical protein HBI42_200760 [Parastagonospora nodorum]
MCTEVQRCSVTILSAVCRRIIMPCAQCSSRTGGRGQGVEVQASRRHFSFPMSRFVRSITTANIGGLGRYEIWKQCARRHDLGPWVPASQIKHCTCIRKGVHTSPSRFDLMGRLQRRGSAAVLCAWTLRNSLAGECAVVRNTGSSKDVSQARECSVAARSVGDEDDDQQ